MSDTCTWKEQATELHYPTFETECGRIYFFADGGPIDNEVEQCPYCGRDVVEELAPAVRQKGLTMDQEHWL